MLFRSETCTNMAVAKCYIHEMPLVMSDGGILMAISLIADPLVSQHVRAYHPHSHDNVIFILIGFIHVHCK
jgi:hypothetical protein